MTAVSGAQYTVASGDGRGITLDDVLAFVAQVERLDPSLMNAKLWAATSGQDLKTLERLQVRGGIPTDVPAAKPDADPQVEGPLPASSTQEALRTVCQRWAVGEISAVHAMRSMCIGLGVPLNPDPDDEDDD